MLPLDHFNDEALSILKERNLSENDFYVVLRMDLDNNSAYHEIFLAIDTAIHLLYRIDPANKTVDTFELAFYTDPYIDSYMTTNRLFVYHHDEPRPDKDAYKEDEETYKSVMKEYRERGTTVILGNCTNACKRKLFAFTTIWERLLADGSMAEDDPVFDQFNARCPKCGNLYSDQSRRICSYCINKRGTFARLIGYFKNYKKYLFIVIACLVMNCIIGLVNPLVHGKLLYDQVIDRTTYRDADDNLYYYYYGDGTSDEEGADAVCTNKGDVYYVVDEEAGICARYLGDVGALTESGTGHFHKIGSVWWVAGLILAFAIGSSAIGVVQNRCNAVMSTRVSEDMKNEVFTAMQHQSMSFFNKNSTGRLMSAVNYDVAVIRNFYLGSVPSLLIHVAQFIFITILLFIINWRLTAIVFIPIPIIVVYIKIFLPKLWHSWSKAWRASSKANNMMNDTFSGVRVVKAFAKEGEETNRFYHLADKMHEAGLICNKYGIILWPVCTCILCVMFQFVWGVGGVDVMNQRMTYGELASYWGYIGMLYGPLMFFTTFTNEITTTINSAVRMFEVLDAVPEVCNAADHVVVNKIDGHIEFDHVFFHYTPNRPILKDVCFEIQPGDHVGLVGHTGSGKSTIANLITRMYDVVSGSIRVDGHDIRELDIGSLRRNVSIVSQDIFIFYGTIADNIRYAKPEATLDEVIEAARKANAHDFIMRLPEGYQTMVGSGCRSLSGGEQQRISIARALLTEPSLLILDEATAAMDTETERQISEAIDKLIVGKTTITIAHRLSTLRNCNYMMAIEDGEVAEIGTPEELLAKKGVYYKLYTLQNDQMNKVMQGL